MTGVQTCALPICSLCFPVTIKGKIEQLANKAISKIDKTIDSEDERLSFDASKWVYEQVHGKSTPNSTFPLTPYLCDHTFPIPSLRGFLLAYGPMVIWSYGPIALRQYGPMVLFLA